MIKLWKITTVLPSTNEAYTTLCNITNKHNINSCKKLNENLSVTQFLNIIVEKHKMGGDLPILTILNSKLNTQKYHIFDDN